MITYIHEIHPGRRRYKIHALGRPMSLVLFLRGGMSLVVVFVRWRSMSDRAHVEEPNLRRYKIAASILFLYFWKTFFTEIYF